MTTLYSPNLQLSLMGPGDQVGNWGNINNTNLGTLLEQAISGGVSFSCTGGTDSLGSMTPGVSATTRNMYITLTGTGGGTVTCPTNNKLYFIYNSTASAITFKTVSGTGISVPAGQTYILYCNGTNVVQAYSGVAQLVAGTNVTLSPTNGTGIVTVNATTLAPTYLVKTSATSRTVQTLSADPDLQYAVPSAGIYQFNIYVQATLPNVNGGLALNLNYTGAFSSTLSTFTASFGTLSSTFTTVGYTVQPVLYGQLQTNLTNTPYYVQITGVLDASSSGTFSLVWSQSVANASATSVNAGSYMSVLKLA